MNHLCDGVMLEKSKTKVIEIPSTLVTESQDTSVLLVKKWWKISWMLRLHG